MRVLVTGGAGYIGSVIAAGLLARGHEVAVYDDLSRGHRAAVPAGAVVVEGDVRDAAAPRGGPAPSAATPSSTWPRSPRSPSRWPTGALLRRQRAGTAAVIDAAAAGVRRIVFSSTAAVYGDAAAHADRRETPRSRRPTPTARPSSPASGCSAGAPAADGLRVRRAALLQRRRRRRRRGEDHDPETHLIPLALKVARDGAAAARLRRRLPDGRRHLRARLRPRRRPRRRARRRARGACRRRARSTWARGRATRCTTVLDSRRGASPASSLRAQAGGASTGRPADARRLAYDAPLRSRLAAATHALPTPSPTHGRGCARTRTATRLSAQAAAACEPART